MRDVWTWIQVALATVGGALGWYFGQADGMLYALIAFAVLDFIMGLLRHALIERNASSERRWKRGVQKVLIFVLVGVANVIDNQVIGEGHVLRNAVVFFYISSEGLSILEHAAAMGLPVPDKLLKMLQDLHDHDPDRDTTVLDARKKLPEDKEGGDGA